MDACEFIFSGKIKEYHNVTFEDDKEVVVFVIIPWDFNIR